MTDKEAILSATRDGLDVFLHYFKIEENCRLFKNKFRKETHPSCQLRYRNGKYILKDYGSSEWTGDCFHVVGKIFGLDTNTQFIEILHVIDKDLNLYSIGNRSNSDKEYSPVLQPDAELTERKPLQFKLRVKPYTDGEIAYWNKYGIGIDILRKYHVKSVERCEFTKSDGKKFRICSSVKSSCFAYLLNNGKGIKFYRPSEPTRFLFAGEILTPYVFGYSQLPASGDTVYITGGEKDVLSLVSHGFNAMCFNSETSSIPDKYISNLSYRFQHIVFMYDTDVCGRMESTKRVGEFKRKGYENVHNVILPLAGTKEEKDISDFFSMGRQRNEIVRLTISSINGNGE